MLFSLQGDSSMFACCILFASYYCFQHIKQHNHATEITVTIVYFFKELP